MNIPSAVKSKNKSLVNRAYTWLIKHNTYNNERDIIENNLECYPDDSVQWRRINKKCEDSFDKFECILEELPKYEVKAIEKSELY